MFPFIWSLSILQRASQVQLKEEVKQQYILNKCSLFVCILLANALVLEYSRLIFQVHHYRYFKLLGKERDDAVFRLMLLLVHLDQKLLKAD